MPSLGRGGAFVALDRTIDPLRHVLDQTLVLHLHTKEAMWGDAV
jgi:hypothetical protein